MIYNNIIVSKIKIKIKIQKKKIIINYITTIN